MGCRCPPIAGSNRRSRWRNQRAEVGGLAGAASADQDHPQHVVGPPVRRQVRVALRADVPLAELPQHRGQAAAFSGGSEDLGAPLDAGAAAPRGTPAGPMTTSAGSAEPGCSSSVIGRSGSRWQAPWHRKCCTCRSVIRRHRGQRRPGIGGAGGGSDDAASGSSTIGVAPRLVQASSRVCTSLGILISWTAGTNCPGTSAAAGSSPRHSSLTVGPSVLSGNPSGSAISMNDRLGQPGPIHRQLQPARRGEPADRRRGRTAPPTVRGTTIRNWPPLMLALAYRV